MKTVINAFIYLIAVLAFFIYVGKSVTDLTGGERREEPAAAALTPEWGETIFFGKGRCFTCHSVGDEGSSVRGPNLGIFGEKFSEPIGLRAARRAKERSANTGEEYRAADYLVESLAAPSAYLVEGYKDEMAKVFAPPIALSLEEMKGVILYLQSQGGEPDIEALQNPSALSKRFYSRIAAASEAGGGDPEKGALVFEDNCRPCHRTGGGGGTIGPDLSSVGFKGVKFLSTSIQRPAEAIAKGYETFLVINKEGRQFAGVKRGGSGGTVDIVTAKGEALHFSKDEIAEMREDKNRSLMPEDFMDGLTVREYQDLLAYLLIQKDQNQGD